MSQQVKFNLGNFDKLGGGNANMAFEAELAALVKDCEERPFDNKPREVVVKVRLYPKTCPSSPHICNGVKVEVEVPPGRRPAQRTALFDMAAKHDGSLFFHPDLPEAADGDALYDADVRERERAARQAKQAT